MDLYVKINNLPNSYKTYIVARCVDDELWYWGSWDNEELAHAAAWEINGIVAHADEIDLS